MGIITVFGPPGCGKTEFLKQTSNGLINVEKRCSREETAYLAFGRKAAWEAAERCGIKPEERREMWYRTLHSACYRILGIKGNVVTSQKLKEFSKRIGVQVDSDLAAEGDEYADLAEVLLAVQRNRSTEQGEEQPSKVIAVFQLSRLLCRTASQLAACRTEPHPVALRMASGMVDVSQYRALVAMYEAWKRSEGLNDFVDMLERIVTENVALPSWKYAFTDESQDLAPLQWAVIEKLFVGRVNDLFLAGDDDQAIMGFQGASAEDFLSFRGRGRKIHLLQTHRFGAPIVELAREIALRLSVREDKDVIPAPDRENTVGTLYEFNPKLHPGRKFLLHRHVAGCHALARLMISHGVPFWNERGVNPLARKSEIRGYAVFARLARGEPVTAFDVSALLDVTPSFRQTEGERVRFVKHGSKKKLSEENPRSPYTLAQLEAKHFTPELGRAIRERRFDIMHVEFPEYYHQLENSGWNLFGDDEPDALITTIHGSKGRERESVFLWDEVTHKCMRDENEHRVAYVGATRPIKNLYVVQSKVITNWSTTRYPYPVSQSVIDEV